VQNLCVKRFSLAVVVALAALSPPLDVIYTIFESDSLIHFWRVPPR
jgi:hypothetical protein